MEPTNSSAFDQPENAQPAATAGAETSGAATSSTSNATGQNSSDSKSWTEFADPQKLQALVEQLPQGVRDFFASSWQQVSKSWGQVGGQVSKLSTTQKVAGAAALAGLGYLALRPGKKSASKSSSAGAYRGYRGASPTSTYKRPEQNYSGGGYSSSGHYYSAGSEPDESRRLDRGPGHWAGSSDQANASSASGSYSTDSAASSGAGSGAPSSSTYRGTGSQSGASSSANATDPDFDNGI